MIETIKKMPLKKKLFYGALIIIVIFAMGFSGDYTLNWRKERNELKKEKKKAEKLVESLRERLEVSDEFQDDTAEQQYNYYYDFQREKKLRIRYEKENFIFRNFNRFQIDSFLSRYNYRVYQ